MAKLINMLAGAVGGGLMLGAGIRLGEAIAGGYPALPRGPALDGTLSARLGALEGRLRSLESGGLADSGLRIQEQAAEVASLRSQLLREDRQTETPQEIGLRLRGELQGWLEENVGSRIADVELKLRAESERSQKQMLDAFVDGVQTRVMLRITRLEEEVTGQSTAMAELRECSLRTEQSMQKLLGTLDRLIVAQSTPAPPAEEAVPVARDDRKDPEPSPPAEEAKSADEPPQGLDPQSETQPPASLSSGETPRKSRRWGIFG